MASIFRNFRVSQTQTAYQSAAATTRNLMTSSNRYSTRAGAGTGAAWELSQRPGHVVVKIIAAAVVLDLVFDCVGFSDWVTASRKNQFSEEACLERRKRCESSKSELEKLEREIDALKKMVCARDEEVGKDNLSGQVAKAV